MATAAGGTAATTTPPYLPGYQVSGAGAAAASAAPRHGSGSVGAFLAVLTAVLVVTALSCVVGRVCSARAEGPDERYVCAAGLAGRRWWRWRRAPRRPVRPAEETKQPAALPPPPPPPPAEP